MDPTEPPPRALTAAVGRLAVAQVLVLCLWFSVAAVLPGLARAHGLAVVDLAHLSSMTQLGFVAGAIGLAMSGLADRVDPRRVFIVTTLIAAISNLALLFVAPTGVTAALSRLVVGAALAGVYPVGLKLAIGWTIERRGLVVSVLVGALTLGSSTPHLVALLGGADPSTTLATTSGLRLLERNLDCGDWSRPLPCEEPPGQTARSRYRIPAIRASAERTLGTSGTCGSSMLSGPGSESLLAPRRRPPVSRIRPASARGSPSLRLLSGA